MNSRGIYCFQFIALALIMYGCYPYPEEVRARSDLDTVVSTFREDVDFQGFTRYFLWDSVALLVDEGETVDPDDPFYANGLDQLILSEVEVQMNALGYQRVNENQGAQIGVVATALRNENTAIVSNPGWWWSYPGYGWWWQPWYGSGYPFYGGGYFPPWYTTYYQYTKGSVTVDMLDLNSSDAESALIWTAIVNGLLDESQTDATGQRIQAGVESAFLQSRNFYPREQNSN